MIAQKIYEKKLKLPKYVKNWVEDYFPVYQFIRKGEEILSSDRKGEIIKRQLRSNTNFERLSKKEYLTVILTTSKRIEYQTFRVFFDINPITKKEVFQYRLHAMLKFENNKVYGIHYNPYTQDVAAGFRGINYGGFRHADEGLFYPIDNNDFKNSQLKFIENIACLISPSHYSSRTFRRLERAYKYRTGIEGIQRLGGYRLVEQIVNDYNNNVDMRILTKSFVIRNRKHIQNNFAWEDVLLMETCRELGVPENIEYSKIINVDQLKSLKIHPAQHSKTRLLNYILKQGKDYIYYRDYLHMLDQLGIPAEERIVFYPKDLIVAHDDAVDKINLLNISMEVLVNKPLDDKTQEVYKELSKLEYTGDKYQVLAPRNLTDIMLEGKNLNHCVGGSMHLKGHSNQDFAIMFVREKDKRDESLVTFTYEYDGRVSQVQGYGNRNNLEYLPEIKEFIFNEWLEKVVNGEL